MAKRECSFKGRDDHGIPPECEGPISYVRRDFYRGEARKANGGPHAWFCKGHGEWYMHLNPFGGVAAISDPKTEGLRSLLSF